MTVRQLWELLNKLPDDLDEKEIVVSVYDGPEGVVSKHKIKNVEYKCVYTVSGNILEQLEIVCE